MQRLELGLGLALGLGLQLVLWFISIFGVFKELRNIKVMYT